MLQLLNQTIGNKREIGAESLSNILTWIDSPYAVHPDMKSFTEGTMSLGWGLIHRISLKH